MPSRRVTCVTMCNHANRITLDIPLVSLPLPAQNGWTGLIRACVNGDYAMAGILLKKGANVNAQVEAHPLSPVSHVLASAQPRRQFGVVRLCGHI